MKRRKLQLATRAEKQNTLLSYFNKTGTSQNGSETSVPKETVKCNSIPSSVDEVEKPSVKRSSNHSENDCGTEAQSQPSSKKAKICNTEKESEDLIPATPKDTTPPPKGLKKSKSRRSISFAPSSVLLQSKKDMDSVSNSNTLKSENQPVIQPDSEHKTLSGSKGLSGSVTKSIQKPCNITSNDDPLLAEILGHVKPANKEDSMLSVTKQSNERQSTSVSKHTLKSRNIINNCNDDVLAEILAEVNPAEKIVSRVPPNKQKNINVQHGVPEIPQNSYSNKPQKESKIKKDAGEVILKDTTATKSSSNKGDAKCDNCPKKNETRRNIFLDPSEGEDESNLFFKKKSFLRDNFFKDCKQDTSANKKNSTNKESGELKAKSRISLLPAAPAETSSPDAHNNIRDAGVNYPSLDIIKEKLLSRKGLRLSSPTVSENNKKSNAHSSEELSKENKSRKPSNDGSAQENYERKPCSEAITPLAENACSSNAAKSDVSSEKPSEALVLMEERVPVKSDVHLEALPECHGPQRGTGPCKSEDIEKSSEKIKGNVLESCVSLKKTVDDIDQQRENGQENPHENSKIPKEEKIGFDLDECFDMHEIDGFQDDWGLSQLNSKENDSRTVPSYPETLELDTARHCKVISSEVIKPNREFILWVQCDETKKTASCTVRGSWALLTVKCDDTVCLEAVLADNTTCSTRWIIDDTRGTLVIHPDTLISGTAVAGSLFCARKSVLSDSFKGVDGSSPVMAIGTLVHEILQEVLKENLSHLEDIQRKAEIIIANPNNIRMFYDSGLSLSQVHKELDVFVPTIARFVSKYVDIKQPNKHGKQLSVPTKQSFEKPGSSKGNSEDWTGRIVAIEDIEENLWDPVLGIKGKIDVTVKVKGSNGQTKLLPLELKTGRASHSNEHRGQVMLYSMMLSRLGIPVESGLLLYLREGSIREVKLAPAVRRDLIMLRNTLAHHLVIKAEVDVNDIENIPTLPEPIHFANACSKCAYLTICSVHLRKDTKTKLEENHPMSLLSVESTKHLTDADLDYFFQAVRMIQLESKEELRVGRMRNIWSMAPEKREKLGQSLVNLKIQGAVQQNAGKFVHTFTRNAEIEYLSSQPLSDDFRRCNLNVGDYIVVSTNTRVAVDTGYILDIDSVSISVGLNRDLRKRNANDVFHIDTYESNVMLGYNLSNLANLMEDTHSAKRVRQAVVEKVPPSFSREVKRDVMQKLMPILAKLNRAQRDAVLAVLKADQYVLIKGLPGTGKTATMVALVCLLVKLGQSVLITSQTHSAVDNLLLRLKQKRVNFLRVGSAKRIHADLLENSEDFVTRDCRTPDDLKHTFDSFQVVGVVCLGMNHPLFSRERIFDYCLVDESTQVLQSTVIRPLVNAQRFVLVGDPDQLPPVVRSRHARELGLGVSLFARLDQGEATKSLDLNYRMNQCITDLANKLTYKNKLKCGNKDVANAALELPNSKVLEDLTEATWLKTVLTPSLESSVFFLDSRGTRLDPPSEFVDSTASEFGNKIETPVVNYFEIAVLQKILKYLVRAEVDLGEVGIIAPYRAQVSLIRKVFEASGEYTNVEVNSVDQYQGRDKQVIMYSCTRSDSSSGKIPKEHEILNDHRRLTVAVTRAKRKLILIGDFATLKNYEPFAKLFSCLNPEQKIDLPQEL